MKIGIYNTTLEEVWKYVGTSVTKVFCMGDINIYKETLSKLQ